MSCYTKTVLTIYFIFGLPALPAAILMFLIRRFIFEEENIFKKENRQQLVFDLCVYMFTFTTFFGGLWALIHYLNHK